MTASTVHKRVHVRPQSFQEVAHIRSDLPHARPCILDITPLHYCPRRRQVVHNPVPSTDGKAPTAPAPGGPRTGWPPHRVAGGPRTGWQPIGTVARPIDERARHRAPHVLDARPSEIDTALVGGIAVSTRTEPRFTRDLDFAVAVADDAAAET